MTSRSARRRAGIVLAILTRALVAHADAQREVEACIGASEEALAQRKAGKLLDARASLSTCAASSCPAVVRASCGQRLAEVNESIPSIAFLPKDREGHDLAAVKLTVDDGAYVGYPSGAALSLDPGVHAFRFEVAGEAPLSTNFVLLEGDQNRRETIVFGGPVGNGRRQRAIGLTVGAVGLAGLAAGAVLGVMTISAHQSFEQNCGSNIGAPPGGCNAAGVSGQHDAATKGTFSTIALIAGGAVFATGAVLFFSAPRGGSSVQLGLSAGGVALRGRF
jgi:hypothetical protein